MTDRPPTTHGVVIIDKPRGPTSHDVVARMRRVFRQRGVGHAGTLDPMATGVLVVLLGEGTKLSGYLTLDDKRYRTTVQLGVGTDSLDADGTESARAAVPDAALSASTLEAALDRERCREAQIPPQVSAIQQDGRRAHAAARSGAPLDLPPRPVALRALSLLGVDHDAKRLSLELTVSKGYYVRALARDLGATLGVPAHLVELRRLASGGFTADDAVPLPTPDEGVRPTVLSVAAAARRALPVATLTGDGEARARVGKKLQAEHFVDDAAAVHQAATEVQRPVAWFGPSGALVALGEARHDDVFAVVRGFSVEA